MQRNKKNVAKFEYFFIIALKDLLQEISMKYNEYQQQVVQQIIQKQQKVMQNNEKSDIVKGE